MPISTRSFVKFSPALDRRRLAALMFTDIVGYSAIFHRDEALAMRLLGLKCQVLREIFPTYGGREIKTLGDGFFIEFPSVLEAVKCAYDIQSQLYQKNLGGMVDERFQIRIGIHLCDFIATDEDAFGNDVNVSSRLEKIAPPGGICVSQQVVDQVSDKLDLKFKPLKERNLKNIKRPVVSYSVDLPWFERRETPKLGAQLEKWIPKKVTIKNSFLIASLSLVSIAGFVLWAVFLMPKNALTDPTAMEHFLSSWENLMILNPIYAVILWGLWLFQPQDRRLVYLSMVFSIGSLSLIERIPVAYTGLSVHALQMVHLLAAGLIVFPFIALEGLEKDKKYNEMVGNVGLAAVVFAALFFVPRTEMANLRWATFAVAVAATAYFIRLVGSKVGKGPLPINDMRRLLIVFMAAGEILSQNFPNVLNSGVTEFFDVFFPVAFPAYFTVFMILGFVTQERMNVKKDRSGMAVRKITNIVCSADCYDDKLSNIQDVICTHLNAERSTIYLADLKGNNSVLHAQAIYGPTDKLKEVALQVDPTHGLIGRVMKTRSPLLVDDFKKEDRLSDEERSHIKVNEYRTRSCLLCPLIMGNEILGVMTFSDKRGSVPFTEDDLRLVQLIAKDVAMLSLHARFQNMVDHFVSEKLNELNRPA
ncbi:GAF domain-containing protein [Bdellovibrio sp. HCB209]|uniref:GAF domain-containing protein n=1 Tax=Bdellovibrio sp. HCB209 TaxID=3394354 RepID=UPI0039B58EBC